jgi:putative FmdB family regulatory protein
MFAPVPIYDYQCRRCKHRFEQLVRPGQAPDCPACGAAGPERLFPATAVVSTARSRERALAGARTRASAVKKEKDRAHQIYLQNHIKDHS